MTDDPTAEVAVRRYLSWIEDPGSAVDQEAIESARRTFLAATDSIDRLHAAAALERAKSADSDRIVADFVTHARAYADAEGIPVEAFRALKVPDEVLARAGFSVPLTRGSAARGRRASRSPQVSVASLKEAAAKMTGRFTLAQLADEAGGGSPATVKKAVEELIGDGRVVRIGPDPDHSGQGRAPVLYELS